MRASYWLGAVEDEAMQDEHELIWRAMLETIDVELGGRRVLGAGCNRGGFLRLLADRCGIAEGFGYGPAGALLSMTTRCLARSARFHRRRSRLVLGRGA